MSPELFDKFARVVKSFSNSSNAQDAALQCAALTTEESEPSDFLYCESNTWKLLAALASSKNKSALHNFAMIKQWVSKIPADTNLLDKIRQEDLLDQEVEEELNTIVRKNRLLKSSPSDQRPTKIRRRNTEGIEQEASFESRYKQLRYGDLSTASDGDENGYVYNEYIKYNQIALEYEENGYGKINHKERSTWREYVQHMSKDESLGKYGKTFYYTLGGNIPDLCALQGQTWEDVIWIYVNGREQDMMDLSSSTSTTTFLDKETSQIALQKDHIMNLTDPRILFHQVQTAILSDTTHQLISQLHQGYIHHQWHATLCMSQQVQAQFLRFVATWILFGRVFMDWKEESLSTELLMAYTQMNAQHDTFRPIVIASYAVKLPISDQVVVFSKFLEDFDGDDEECAIILRLGKEYGLEMTNILQTTNRNLFRQAIDTSTTLPATEFEITSKAPDQEQRYDLFFRSLHWLLIDPKLALEAVKAANKIIRYFLSIKKIYLVQQVFDLVPESAYEMLVVTGRLDEVIEFDLHRQVMLIFIKYHAWFTLVQSKPEDSGKLVDLQNIYKWRDQVEKQTVGLEEHIKKVLEGNWADTVDTLRQLYLPEILIRYHNILYMTSTIIAKNEEKARNLNVYLASQHKKLYNDVRLSNSMPDVIKQFSKSLFSDNDGTSPPHTHTQHK